MFSTETVGAVAVVTAAGELDARNAARAKEYLRGLIDGGQARLVLDLGTVSFIDSSGLGALLATLKAARLQGGDVRLCALAPAVKSVFELTRMYRVFDLFEDRPAAVASFG